MKKFLNTNNLEKTTKYAIFVIVLGFAGNLAFSLLTTDKHIFESLSAFQPTFLILAVVLALVPWFTSAIRLFIWTRFLGKKFSFFSMLKIVLSTDIGSAISPTAIGGGYVKAGLLMKKGLTAGTATSLMSLGSVEDGLFFAIAVPLSLYVSKDKANHVLQHISSAVNWEMLCIPGLIVLVLVLSIFILRHVLNKKKIKHPLGQKIKTMLSKGWTDFKDVYGLIGRRGKKYFLLSMIFTAVQWSCRYSVITALAASFNLDVDPAVFFLFQWITFSLMTLIPTPGATAGAEASFFMVYSTLLPKEYIGLMTTGWRFLTFYFQLGIVLIVLGSLSLYSFQKARIHNFFTKMLHFFHKKRKYLSATE